jgi:hypothetical protein
VIFVNEISMTPWLCGDSSVDFVVCSFHRHDSDPRDPAHRVIQTPGGLPASHGAAVIIKGPLAFVIFVK